MDFRALVQAMSAETYQRLVESVSTKRWADGQLMSDEQHEHAMQLVLAYQSQVLKSTEPFTVGANGEMVLRSKAELKAELQPTPAIARFTHDDI